MTADPIIDECNALRRSVKEAASRLDAMRQALVGDNCELIANLTLAYRHLEDASMRLGKAIQAQDGGVSVYDRETTVGA